MLRKSLNEARANSATTLGLVYRHHHLGQRPTVGVAHQRWFVDMPPSRADAHSVRSGGDDRGIPRNRQNTYNFGIVTGGNRATVKSACEACHLDQEPDQDAPARL